MRETFVRGALWRQGRRWALAVALVALVALCLGPAQARSLVTDDENLSPMGNEYQPCIRQRDNREGLCVPFTQCYKNQSIAHGGNIYKYEVRDGAPLIRDCGRNNWCCTDDSGLSSKPDGGGRKPDNGGRTESSGNCLRAYDECQWCVALYRPGGDVARGQRSESGLYCGGALVGPSAVLTSAGCVATVGNESVWARVPGSAAPARRYAVANRLRHDDYNSGNSKNDFGFLVLKEAVEFATNPSGACVSFAPPPAAACRAVGFNSREEIVLTPVSLRDGDCPPRNRTIHDLVCAKAVSAPSAPCDISPGAPVLCPGSDVQGGLEIAGVVRRSCRGGAAQLGKLQPHAEWLQLQLRRLGVHAWQ